MTSFSILLGGKVEVTNTLKELVSGSRVIAADSGIRYAQSLGCVPELWVGDFDSSDEELTEKYKDVPKLGFPSDKDKTDGELAIEEALKKGAEHLILVGAFGGSRSDHEFLHMALAMRLSEKGVKTVLTDGHQTGYPLSRQGIRLEFGSDTEFSILGFDALFGLTISGAKWPLDDVDVAFGSSLTLSNVANGHLEVSLRSGRALLIVHNR